MEVENLNLEIEVEMLNLQEQAFDERICYRLVYIANNNLQILGCCTKHANSFLLNQTKE